MPATHLNVFIQDFETAYKDAQGAVDNLKKKGDALIAKLKEEVPQLAARVEADIETAVSKKK